MLRTECCVGSERWNENARAYSRDAWHTPRENSGVAAFDDELADRDESELIRTVAELDVFEDASGMRKVSRVIAADRDAAVAGLGEIFLHRLFGEGPILHRDHASHGEHGRCNDCEDDERFAQICAGRRTVCGICRGS